MRKSKSALMMLAATTMGLSAAMVPSVAQAQFGGLINKVKKAASLPALSSDVPHFDETVVELNPTRLDGVIRGFNASAQAAEGPNGVAALTQQIKASVAEEAALKTAHPSTERDQWVQRNSGVEECRSKALSRAKQAAEAGLNSRMMSDVAFRTTYAKQAQEVQAAAARHDTAAVARIEREMEATVNPHARADTLAANKQCGTPAEPAWVTRLDSLPVIRTRLQNQIRDVQEHARNAGVQASGLTPTQFAAAQERLQLYVGRGNGHGAQPGFSAVELAALDAKDAELREAMSRMFSSVNGREQRTTHSR